MTEKMIIEAYCRIRTIDNTIPDSVLNYMKDCAIERIRGEKSCMKCKYEKAETFDELSRCLGCTLRSNFESK